MESTKKPDEKGQHGISQVYLKEFQYRDKDNKRWLSVLEKGKNVTEYKAVKGFSNLINYFDIFKVDGMDQRTFDQINDILDNEYPKIITELSEKGSLSTENRALGKEIVANFICRTPMMRNRIWNLYNDPATKDKLLNEIAVLGSADTATVIKNVDNIDPSDRLNYLMLFAMNYINLVLMNFQCVILEGYDGREWATSDNPVVLDNNNKYYAIIPFEAELYFPFSKKHCFYLHYPLSKKKKGWLRSHPNGSVVTVSKRLHHKIMLKIGNNAEKHVIFPWDMGKIDLEKLAGKNFIFKKAWYKFIGNIQRIFQQ